MTSYWPEEAGPQRLLQLARDHWSIENGQRSRRDRTWDEDLCPVLNTMAACNLSLFRFLAIFLFKAQFGARGAKQSLPDVERGVRRPRFKVQPGSWRAPSGTVRR